MHDCEDVGAVLFITLTTFYVTVVWVGIGFVTAGEGLKIAPTIFLPLAAASFGFLPRDFSLGLLAALRVAIGPFKHPYNISPKYVSGVSVLVTLALLRAWGQGYGNI